MKKHEKAIMILLSLLVLALCLAGCSVPMKETGDESGTKAPASSSAAAAQTTAAQTEPVPAEVLPAARQLTERWLSGDLSDLAGTYIPAPSDPEEAAKRRAIRDDLAVFRKETEPTESKSDLLGLLRPYTKLTLPEIPADAVFPLEIKGTLETPDIAAILTDLHYENYEDSGKLAEDLAAALEKGDFPLRVTELSLTVERDGDGFYAAPNQEAYLAFYGGLAELYRQEYTKYLEDLGNAVGGQE